MSSETESPSRSWQKTWISYTFQIKLYNVIYFPTSARATTSRVETKTRRSFNNGLYNFFITTYYIKPYIFQTDSCRSRWKEHHQTQVERKLHRHSGLLNRQWCYCLQSEGFYDKIVRIKTTKYEVWIFIWNFDCTRFSATQMIKIQHTRTRSSSTKTNRLCFQRSVFVSILWIKT